MSLHMRLAGQYRRCRQLFVKVAGQWRRVVYTWVNKAGASLPLASYKFSMLRLVYGARVFYPGQLVNIDEITFDFTQSSDVLTGTEGHADLLSPEDCASFFCESYSSGRCFAELRVKSPLPMPYGSVTWAQIMVFPAGGGAAIGGAISVKSWGRAGGGYISIMDETGADGSDPAGNRGFAAAVRAVLAGTAATNYRVQVTLY